jgi:hypothetical protein
MKKILLIVVMAFIYSGINAQTPWYITGNTGTDPSTNFIGTSDPQPLIFKTVGIERMRLSKDWSYLGLTLTPHLTAHTMLENTKLLQPYSLRKTTIAAGKNVNPYPEAEIGDYVIESGGSVALHAGESITLSDGFHAEAGSFFHALVDTFFICDYIRHLSLHAENRNRTKDRKTDYCEIIISKKHAFY